MSDTEPQPEPSRNSAAGTAVRDIGEVQRVLSALGFLNIRAQAGEAPFQMEICRTGMQRAGIFQIRTGQSVTITANPERPCICCCPEGNFTLDCAGRRTKLDQRTAAIVPPTEQLIWLLPAATRIAGVVLADDPLRPGGSDGADAADAFAKIRRFDISTSPGAVFADVLRILTADAGRSRFVPEHQPVCEMLEQLMTNSLSDITGRSARARRSASVIVPRHVKRAEAFIQQHLAEPFDNLHLAKVAGVSSRSLYRGFLQFRGVSPARYVMDLRLRKARQLLENGDDPMDMKEIAATTGFSSYASFWRSYVNKFGRAPSKARPIAPDDDDIPPPHEP